MHFVATLISAPGTQALTDALVRAAAGDLPFGRGPHWLSPSEAADIFFWPEDSDLPENGEEEEQIIRDFSSLLRECVKGAPVDCIVQRNDEHRRKKLFIADMDSTMIGQECIDELAAYVGRKDLVAAITERAMRGEIAFEPALRERVALLKGLPASVADQVIAQNITLTPGGRTLVATMRAHGAYAALVSGGFTLFTRPIAALLGFDEDRANELVLAGDCLSGDVREPILGMQAKLDALLDLSSKRGVDTRAVLAAGDGANDLAMLGAAGLGVAYYAKPAVAAAAQARIDHCDLTSLLFAQGYQRGEFVQ